MAAVLAGFFVYTSSGSAVTRAASCSKDGYNLQGYTYYASVGKVWLVVGYQYRLSGGQVRSRNNVNIKLLRNLATVYSNNSPDNRVNDNRLYTHKNRTLVSKSAFTITSFQAIFDRNNRPDPSCRARTGRL